jgi:2-keto-4-pentenoate hydratase
MTVSTLQTIADRLHHAYGGVPVPPIHDELTPGDVAAAYEIQEINTRRWLAEGRRLVGRKIGLTSKVVQAQMGVFEPDYGMLFADMVYADNQEIPAGQLIQPKIEVEIAVVLARALNDPTMTIVELMRAVDYVLPSVEVVDSRITDWKINIQDTVADNGSSGAVVLGLTPVRLENIDLYTVTMSLEHNGAELSRGRGSDCLGHPLYAALWLARRMAEAGRPLQEGDIIMTGALGPMVPAFNGGVFEGRIDGLGSVRAVISSKPG